jgi:peptidoglycan/xylan/chitin deacetylase (PgdA/CDA1 family)
MKNIMTTGPFIFYHKIDIAPPDARIRGGYTPRKRFAKQIGFMRKEGFNFYTVSQMIEHFKTYGSFPHNGLAITFDDGWKDNYENGFPILQDYGIKATIFLIPSCLGQVSVKAQSEGEGAREHLSVDNVQEMAEYGIEFGSHTLNHKLLDRIPLNEVKTEVEESKLQIEEILNKPCKVLAYPGGHFSDEARKAVVDAGYIAGLSTIYGVNDRLDLYSLNRTEILRRDRFLFQFARKVKPLMNREPS